MRQEPSRQIDSKALKVWKLSGLITSSIFILLAIGSIVLAILTPVPFWISILTVIAALLLTYLFVVVIPEIQYRVWRYEIDEYEIELKFGLFIIRRILVPMVRVQHVDTKQGPLLRRYQLSSVTITTAATTHEIPALDNETANQVRDFISQRARVTEDDV
ncbi:PH domain-containing protein [Alkalihalobacillus sp. AL-G]|uniref:PH domain-containing protein n=1 Tax=Alkalihalobacillus sp. AL-G TaxID=2926399 RepID=UPI00272AA866|nr:PH domain-containing protein [Alkalihalobacillus sp. AL-G]WLD93658.1 PH domain-containing protein [Alkalihalobacillus sp. AL-G]